MKLDEFIRDVSGAEADLSKEQVGKLVGHAEAYLRAGGVITWEFWRNLSEESRSVFEQAGDSLWRARATGLMEELISVAGDAIKESTIEKMVEATANKVADKMSNLEIKTS